MNGIILLLALMSADDFHWNIEQPFSWTITDAAPGAPVESPPLVIPGASVHRLTVRSSDGTTGSGSATHVGGGVWLSCKHVFRRPAAAVEIDGQQVGAKWWVHPTLDFSVVQTDATGFPAAKIGELGDSATIIGAKTGKHAGPLSATRWKPGYRAVICDPPTESGDSGAGVFNAAGEIVGVHWGSTGNEVFFTPLAIVSDFLGGKLPEGPAHTPSPSGPVAAAITPHVTIISPATWDCPHCPGHRDQDWNSAGIKVTFEKRDGLAAYPCTEWVDSRGVTRRLWGRWTPQQVRWSWERTHLEADAATITDAAAAPTPQAEVERILAILQPRANETFVDYGCGDGRWCITAAQKYGCRAVGVEIDPERAAQARAAAAMAGLSGKIEIIEGDATQVDVKADVAVVYLWPDTLEALKGKLQQCDRFASVQHRVPGLAMTQYGDAYVWQKPRQVRGVVWGGRTYYGPVCNSRSCAMCNAIRRGLGQQ